MSRLFRQLRLLVVLLAVLFAIVIPRPSQGRSLRVMVLIVEKNITGSADYWVSLGQAEGAVNRAFLAAGFEVLQPQKVKKDIGSESLVKAVAGDDSETAAFGSRLDADVVVLGEAVASSGGPVMGSPLKSMQADITARAVETDGGRLIASVTARAAKVHVSEVGAGQQALEEAGSKIAEKLIEEIGNIGITPREREDRQGPMIAFRYDPRIRYAAGLRGTKFEVSGDAVDDSQVVEVKVNNVNAALTPSGGGVSFSAPVDLDSGTGEIVVTARDEHGNSSTRSMVVGKAREVLPSKPDKPLLPKDGEKPELWLLSVGLSEYADSSQNLKFADHDARSMAAAMRGQEGKLFDKVHVKELINSDATREHVLEAMTGFLGQASYEDVVMIFMAGHGIQDRQTGSYYFLTYDARPDNLLTKGLLWSTFDEAQKRHAKNVSKMILWLDTCHSGAMKIALRGISVGEELSRMLTEAEGTYMLAASKPGEYSEEAEKYSRSGRDGGHGVFTFTLLEGLDGKADYDKDKIVTVAEISRYVSKEVPKLTEGRQHPYFRTSGTDMPIFVH